MADKVYEKLSNKYYWRHWLVVVYDNMWGDENHQVTVWGEVAGTSWRKLHYPDAETSPWYNIIVSSVSENAAPPVQEVVRSYNIKLNQIVWQKPKRIRGHNGSMKTTMYPMNAKEIHDMLYKTVNLSSNLKTGMYPIFCVIRLRGQIMVRAPDSRKFQVAVNNGQVKSLIPGLFYIIVLG